MRKPPNAQQSARRQDRIEEIRLLLYRRNLTTAQIEYLTGIRPSTLRHYIAELESKNYVSHSKLRVIGRQSENLYRITADGKSALPKPPAQITPATAVSADAQWWSYKLHG